MNVMDVHQRARHEGGGQHGGAGPGVAEPGARSVSTSPTAFFIGDDRAEVCTQTEHRDGSAIAPTRTTGTVTSRPRRRTIGTSTVDLLHVPEAQEKVGTGITSVVSSTDFPKRAVHRLHC